MKLARRKFLHLAAVAAALPAASRIALAEVYPSRPVHWIVGSRRRLGSLAVFLLLFAAEYVEQIFGCPVIEHYFRFLETSSWPPIPDPTHSDRGSFVGILVCCIRRGGRLSQIFIRSDRALAPAATSSHHHKFRGFCARSFHIGCCRHVGECLCERHLFWRRLLGNSPSFNLRRISLPHRLSHIHEPLTAILGSRSINSARYRQAMTEHVGWLAIRIHQDLRVGNKSVQAPT